MTSSLRLELDQGLRKYAVGNQDSACLTFTVLLKSVEQNTGFLALKSLVSIYV